MHLPRRRTAPTPGQVPGPASCPIPACPHRYRSCGWDVVGHPDRLGVQHHRGRILAAAGLLPRLAAEQVMDRVGTVVAPQREVVVSRRLRRRIVWQVHPLAAGPVLVEDRIHDLPQRVPTLIPGRRRVLGLPRQQKGPARRRSGHWDTPSRQPRPAQRPATPGGTTKARISRHPAMTNPYKPTKRPLTPPRQPAARGHRHGSSSPMKPLAPKQPLTST